MRKIYLTLLGFSILLTVFADNDVFYCVHEPDQFTICRTCNSLVKDCEEVERPCKCDNMHMVKPDGYDLYGGPDECDNEDPFCFVYENSKCDDIEYSTVNERIENLWLNSEVYYSYEACEGKKDKVGNEESKDGVKITKDLLRIVQDNKVDLGEELTFYMNTHQECSDECKFREGTCGAWSYDKNEELCHLHTVNANCGQLDKQEENSDWISGYSQSNKCWSTKNDCPCDVKKRLKKQGTAHSTGGSAPLHASGSVGEVSSNNKCACQSFKTRRGRTRCRKPACSKDGCEDERKCRKRD